MMDGYLSARQFARQIGLSDSSLRTWEQRGWAKPDLITKSNRRFYLESRVKEYMEDAKHRAEQHGATQSGG